MFAMLTSTRKGRVLDVLSGGMATLRGQVGSEERAILDALLERREALARLVLRGPGKVPPEAHREAVAKLRGDVEELERQALRRGGVLRSVVAPLEIEDVQVPLGSR